MQTRTKTVSFRLGVSTMSKEANSSSWGQSAAGLIGSKRSSHSDAHLAAGPSRRLPRSLSCSEERWAINRQRDAARRGNTLLHFAFSSYDRLPLPITRAPHAPRPRAGLPRQASLTSSSCVGHGGCRGQPRGRQRRVCRFPREILTAAVPSSSPSTRPGPARPAAWPRRRP